MFTVLARIRLPAVALVGANLIDTRAAVLAGGWRAATFVHILLAGGTMETQHALAHIAGFKRQALAPIGTGVRSTWVCLEAVFP